MELITEILCRRLTDLYPLICPKEYFNHPLSVAYYAENTIWEDGAAYIVTDSSMQSKCFSASTKSAFFCLWNQDEPTLQTNCDIIFLSHTVNPFTLLNDINRIFSIFNHWEHQILACPYTTDGIKEMMILSRQVLPGRISLTDVFLNYIMYNKKLKNHLPDHDISPETTGYNELLDNPQFYKYESVKGVFLYSSITFATLCYNLYRNEKFSYRLIYNNFTEVYTAEEYYIFEYLAQKISSRIEHIPSMSAPIPPNSPLRNCIHQIICGTCPSETVLHDQLGTINWCKNDDYCLVLMKYYFISSEYDAPLFHASSLEHMYPESIAIKHNQGLIWILNLTRNMHLQNYGFLDTFSLFIRESMYKCGISAVINEFSNLNHAYTQASFALKYGLSHMDHLWYFKFEDFYLQYMTAQITMELPSEFICHPALHQIRHYDEQNKTELYRTLYTFINYQYNSSKAARELHIHRTTLLYRLEKISEITKLNLENWETRLHIMFSYQILGT